MTKITDGKTAYNVEMRMRSGEMETEDLTLSIIDWVTIHNTDSGTFYEVDNAIDTVDWIESWEQYLDVFPEERHIAIAEGERIAIIEKIPAPKI